MEVRLDELGIPNGGIVDVPRYSALSLRALTTSHSSSSRLGVRTGGVSVCPIGHTLRLKVAA